MSDRDYLYGHVCRHGSLARSCQVCDLEDEVRRLRAELQGMVAESSWDELADEMTEVEADNERLRDALTEQRDAALSETVDCYNCCDGCPMDAEDYPGWLTAPWALIGDNRE